jgi:hypothetical protein
MQNAESDQYQVPIELERAIFEMAADTLINSHFHAGRPACKEMVRCIQPLFLSYPLFDLTSRVGPLLYRTIPVCEEKDDIPEGYPFFRIDILLDMIQYGKFPSDDVRNLLIQVDCDRATLLSACPKTENLWINPDLGPNLFPQISVLPFKRLTCNLDTLFGPDIPRDFTHRPFSRLTHLEILDNMEYNSEYDPKMLPDLALIPHLSHLAFAYVEGFIDFFLPLPNTCKSLRVLVVLDPYVHTIIAHHKDKEELARDERFVVMERKLHTNDWILGAHTGVNYWSRVEEFVERRRSGEIDGVSSSVHLVTLRNNCRLCFQLRSLHADPSSNLRWTTNSSYDIQGCPLASRTFTSATVFICGAWRDEVGTPVTRCLFI